MSNGNTTRLNDSGKGAAPTDRCKIPSAFWRAIEGAGVRAPALLRQARLPATLHLREQVLLTTSQYFALWRALEQLTGDPGLGIRLVQTTDTAAHPPSSLVAFHARDYRDGLERLARFKRLCTPERLHLADEDGDLAIIPEWLRADEPPPAIATDVTLATLLELGRRGSGHPIVPRRLELKRVKPKLDLPRGYFGCPIRYAAARDALVLKAEDLDRPFPGHNPELLDMLTPALSSALDELDTGSSMAEQVKLVLRRMLASGRPDLAHVAQELGLSDRTLQRRITDAGTSFRDLLADARKDLGRRLLSDPGTDIDEVACLLGYQDASSFYRAFRDWEGVTPNRWRELNGPWRTKAAAW